MAIFEIADQLPNGFHDSEVESIRIDYVSRTLELALNVSVGRLDDAPETREAYRKHWCGSKAFNTA